MKKWILTATAVAVLGLAANSAHAGDREWATVGKVLTGVAAGVVIAKAIEGPPAYTTVSYGYAAPAYNVTYTVSTPPPCPPPPHVVYAPAPVVVYHPPMVCAPAPAYRVTYVHPGRGHGHGHGHGSRHGRW